MRGITKTKAGTYHASITVNKKQYNLCTYKTMKLAREARKLAVATLVDSGFDAFIELVNKFHVSNKITLVEQAGYLFSPWSIKFRSNGKTYNFGRAKSKAEAIIHGNIITDLWLQGLIPQDDLKGFAQDYRTKLNGGHYATKSNCY